MATPIIIITGMQRRLLLLGGLFVLFIVLILGMNALTASRNSASHVCKNFIESIEQGKADASYALFTDAAKSQTNSNVWKVKVNVLQPLYGSKPALTLTDESPSQNPLTNAMEDALTYKLTGVSSRHYLVTCTAQKAGKKFQVDGFTSHLVD